MPSIKDRCTSLILQKKPTEAISLLMNSYDISDDKEAILCYKMWCKIRSEFHRHDRHANPLYERELHSILEDYEDILPEDRQSIEKLLESSLHERYKVFKMCRPYLKDSYLDNRLKENLPALPEIYDFEFPAEFNQRAWQLSRKDDEARLRNGLVYMCSKREAHDVLQKVKLLLEDDTPITSTGQCIDRVICLQIVSGRRFNEIANTAVFTPHSMIPYQAMVQGLLKESSIDTKVHTIPLLIPAKQFCQLLRTVRNWTCDRELPDNYVKRRSLKLFGIPLVHGPIRNLYLELAYENRHQNEFFANSPRTFFDMKALCHQDRLTPTMSYQRLTFSG